MVLRLRGGSGAGGLAAVRQGAAAVRRKAKKLAFLDEAMDVFVQVRIGKEKQRTSLCLNGGANCSWEPDPEGSPEDNAKIKNLLAFDKKNLLADYPEFILEVYEVDGLSNVRHHHCQLFAAFHAFLVSHPPAVCLKHWPACAYLPADVPGDIN